MTEPGSLPLPAFEEDNLAAARLGHHLVDLDAADYVCVAHPTTHTNLDGGFV
ncbi:hypothetical protein [Streptomyces sp. NPDC090798]|uniref:hypothetical protein n=1 Tax=Streptomyces sp. NPDC090798 TaxID=3365968 RepID=UPI00380655ED